MRKIIDMRNDGKSADGPFIRNPWGVFTREGRKLPHYTFWDRLHGYVYMRWVYPYIAFGVGTHPLARLLRKVKVFPAPGAEAGERRKAFAATREAHPFPGMSESYHGKVMPLPAARELVCVKENINLPDLENIIPFAKARELVFLNPDHLAVIECPCRAAREKPCLPLDVCLIVGEQFASLVLERHPARSRRITPAEACRILEAEDERGHVHHAFFKDAMLGRFYAICNCCSCCCGAIQAQKNGTPMLISSGYLCQVDTGLCIGCGLCVDACQFDALQMDEIIRVDADACMGCGVCQAKCPQGALSLVRDETRGEPLEVRALI
jgi:ferredoxin